MAGIEERAADIRRRLKHDIAHTCIEYGVASDLPPAELETIVIMLVEDAMHPVEHLLIEIEKYSAD